MKEILSEAGGGSCEPMRYPIRPVPFHTTLPEAADVRVTGDFSRWTRAGVRLHDDGHGLWRTMLLLPRGAHQYRLLVDGVWADHAEATGRIRNVFGTTNCVLTVP